MAEYKLELRGVCKSFPGVKALDNVQGNRPCTDGGKWCRKINPDEMSVWYL